MGGAKLKICRRCMDYLGVSATASEDLASFMVVTSANGIELVPAEECQPRFVCAKQSSAKTEARVKGLGDVSEAELQAGVDKLVSSLSLAETHRDGIYNLRAAIYNEWLKALKER